MTGTRTLTIASLSATLLFGPFVAAAPSAADPTPIQGTVRLAGVDRYATAVEVSKSAFSSQEEVFIASGEDFPDGLTAGTAAGRLRAPLLLTRRSSLPEVVASELRRLSPSHVFVVGGRAAVSDSVVTAIQKTIIHGNVERVSGIDRYATAEAVSHIVEVGPFTRALIVTGESFADGLSAGAAAAAIHGPLLLTTRTSLPAATRRALVAGGAHTVGIVGGTGVVSSGVESELRKALPDATVFRLAGADRYATANVVANDVFGDHPPATAFYVSGSDFADALAATPAAATANRDADIGVFGAPVLPTTRSCHPAPIWSWTQGGRDRVAIGGPAVVYGGINRC